MKKLYLQLNLSLITNEKIANDLDSLVTGLIQHINHTYKDTSYFELLGYSQENPIPITKNIIVEETIPNNKSIEKIIDDELTRQKTEGIYDEKNYFSGHLKDPEDNMLMGAICSHCNKTFERRGKYSYVQGHYCDDCINGNKT